MISTATVGSVLDLSGCNGSDNSQTAKLGLIDRCICSDWEGFSFPLPRTSGSEMSYLNTLDDAGTDKVAGYYPDLCIFKS